MSGLCSALLPKTKKVAFTPFSFNVCNIVDVTVDGPSSNVKNTLLFSE